MTDGEATDGELLRRFITHHDDRAFADLVHRHGPAVLGVCRRVLRDPNDADDAFQATFLVLIRKAASIARTPLLAGWLYGVAYRTALEAKTRAARRRARERHVVPAPPVEPVPDVVWADLRPVLDEEVSRLPEKYRSAFVLCHLQGRTNEEAARLLGCPKGTILSRLAWARERLRDRLSRRGLTLSAGMLTGLLSLNEVSAAVPAGLSAAAGQAAATGAVPSRVAELTEGVLKAMWFTKLKALASVLVVVAVLGTVGLFGYRTLAGEGKAAKKGKSDKELLQGTWAIVSAEHGGEKAPAKAIEGCTLSFKGDKATLTMQGRTQEAGIALDPDKKPKQMDMTVDEGGKEEVHLAIYKLEGDTLTICKSHPPQERPTAFATKAGEKWPALLVFKRQAKAGDK